MKKRICFLLVLMVVTGCVAGSALAYTQPGMNTVTVYNSSYTVSVVVGLTYVTLSMGSGNGAINAIKLTEVTCIPRIHDPAFRLYSLSAEVQAFGPHYTAAGSKAAPNGSISPRLNITFPKAGSQYILRTGFNYFVSRTGNSYTAINLTVVFQRNSNGQLYSYSTQLKP